MGGGQSKKIPNKRTFQPKTGSLFKKNPKDWTFHITWGSIQEWGGNQADTVVIFIKVLKYLVTFFPKTIEVSRNFSKFIELTNKISQYLCKGN